MLTPSLSLTEMVFKRFIDGKKANWTGSVEHKHSFTYTSDAGRATALLSNTTDAYNQVWHLPTAANPLTGKEWIEAIAKEMGVEPGYQYDPDYVFDSSKFEGAFDYKLTPYPEGIREIVNKDYS